MFNYFVVVKVFGVFCGEEAGFVHLRHALLFCELLKAEQGKNDLLPDSSIGISCTVLDRNEFSKEQLKREIKMDAIKHEEGLHQAGRKKKVKKVKKK